MQTAPLPFVVMWLCGHYQQQTAVCASLLDFPQPFLTVKQAEVLRLNCTPPPEEAKLWHTVFKILIKVQLNGKDTENTSVAVLQPGKKAEPGKLLQNFFGNIDSDSSSLAVTMALEGQYGKYYCDIEYSRPTTESPRKNFIYSRKVYVSSDSPSRGSSEAFAHIDIVDKVRVVWYHPNGLDFFDASVIRYYKSEADGMARNRQALYHVIDDKECWSHKPGVLMASFRKPLSSELNYTMTVYVTPKEHYPVYTCKVWYKGCHGDNEDKCSCGPHGAIPVSSSEFTTAVAVGLGTGLPLLLVIVLLISCFCLARRGGNSTVNKLFKKDTEEPSNEMQTEKETLLSGGPSDSEGQNNACQPGLSHKKSSAEQYPPQLLEANHDKSDRESEPVEINVARSPNIVAATEDEGSTPNSRNHQPAGSNTSTSPATAANRNNTDEGASRYTPATTINKNTAVTRNTPESASGNVAPGGASSNSARPSSAEVKQPIVGEAGGSRRVEDNQNTDDTARRSRQQIVQESSHGQNVNGDHDVRP